MIDIERLAEAEGEVWAKRLLGHLQHWSEPIESTWPGRLQEARMLAQRIEPESAQVDWVAERIQAHATQVWTRLSRSGGNTLSVLSMSEALRE
jgi:hypothetical protein